MKFFEDTVKQKFKNNQIVCGDAFLCQRTPERTLFVLSDGIGSGVYANIAAITCANRLMELWRSGVSVRTACRMVADSMHKAKEADIPFSAFTAAMILNDGQFSVYSYESPNPVLIQGGIAQTLEPVFLKAGYEILGESTGMLDFNDSLVLFSDGVTQAGLGNGYSLGIEALGVQKFINRLVGRDTDHRSIPGQILEMCREVSGGHYGDDTSVAVLHCREASQMTLLTGPPAQKSRDREYARKFMNMPGFRVVCGSTTADILSRELQKEVQIVQLGSSYGSPPEYSMEGVDMVTEGAVMLNQVYNILEEDPALFTENTVVERLCALMLRVDVITFMVGNAINDAHEALVFKQVGVRARHTAVRLLAERLQELGKLVTLEYW